MEGVMRRQLEWVEVTLAVTSERHLVGVKILDRETRGIKIHQHIVITG
jgi:hypothetical protein